MKYTVRLARKARAEIDANAAWLAYHISKRTADRWHESVSDTIETLAEFPDRCPAAEEADSLAIDLRQLLHGRRPHVFRILFTIEGDQVLVHRVRHAAQDWIADLEK